MQSDKVELRVIRGTGYEPLDGAIVQIVDTVEVDGAIYCVVRPPHNKHSAVGSFLVESRYLQEAKDLKDKYSYHFTCSKVNTRTGETEQDYLVIDDALRDVRVSSILEKVKRDLVTILRME